MKKIIAILIAAAFAVSLSACGSSSSSASDSSSKAESNAESKDGSKSESKDESKSESKDESKTESKDESKTESKTESSIEDIDIAGTWEMGNYTTWADYTVTPDFKMTDSKMIFHGGEFTFTQEVINSGINGSSEVKGTYTVSDNEIELTAKTINAVIGQQSYSVNAEQGKLAKAELLQDGRLKVKFDSSQSRVLETITYKR